MAGFVFDAGCKWQINTTRCGRWPSSRLVLSKNYSGFPFILRIPKVNTEIIICSWTTVTISRYSKTQATVLRHLCRFTGCWTLRQPKSTERTRRPCPPKLTTGKGRQRYFVYYRKSPSLAISRWGCSMATLRNNEAGRLWRTTTNGSSSCRWLKISVVSNSKRKSWRSRIWNTKGLSMRIRSNLTRHLKTSVVPIRKGRELPVKNQFHLPIIKVLRIRKRKSSSTLSMDY